jgi:transcriptional regulator
MAAHFTVYTVDVIEKIRTMRAAGKTYAEVARVIGTTPGSLSARLSQLKLTKRKPQPQPEIAAA